MTFQNILLPVFGDPSDEFALRTALHVVRMFDGHLDGLHVQHDILREMSLRDESMSITLIRGLAEHVREAHAVSERAARRRFEQILAAEKIVLCTEQQIKETPSAAWLVATGREAEVFGHKGGAYDLIVFDSVTARSHDEMRDALKAVLFETGRPVLLAPPAAPTSIGKTILLCWNKTAQSAHATIAAMPFLNQANRVVIMTVATGAKQGPTPMDLAQTMAWNGIEAEVADIKPDDRPVGQILLDHATAISADLLVMGAYSRTRWSELILGGVTKYIIKRAELPVLMAH